MYYKPSLKSYRYILRLSLLIGCMLGTNVLCASNNHTTIKKHFAIIFGEESPERELALKNIKENNMEAFYRQLEGLQQESLSTAQKEAYKFLINEANFTAIYQWVDQHYLITTQELRSFFTKCIKEEFLPHPSQPSRNKKPAKYAAEVEDWLKEFDNDIEILLRLAKKYGHLSAHWLKFIMNVLKAQVTELQSQVTSNQSALDAVRYNQISGDLAKVEALLEDIIQFLATLKGKQDIEPSVAEILLFEFELFSTFDRYLDTNYADRELDRMSSKLIPHNVFGFLNSRIKLIKQEKPFPLKGLEGFLHELKSNVGKKQAPKATSHSRQQAPHKRWLFFILFLIAGGLLLVGIFSRKKTSRA